MVPKPKSSDGGLSDMLKRSHKLLPLNEKVKCIILIKKKSCAEVGFYNKNEYSFHENVRQKYSCIVHLGFLMVSAVSDIHWGSWNLSPVNKGGLLYSVVFILFICLFLLLTKLKSANYIVPQVHAFLVQCQKWRC